VHDQFKQFVEQCNRLLLRCIDYETGLRHQRLVFLRRLHVRGKFPAREFTNLP